MGIEGIENMHPDSPESQTQGGPAEGMTHEPAPEAEPVEKTLETESPDDESMTNPDPQDAEPETSETSETSEELESQTPEGE